MNDATVMTFALAELQRRVANLIRVGVIDAVDVERARVRVTVGHNTTDWLPWLASAAGELRQWQVPSVGEQVVLLSPQGDYTQGVVLRGLYQRRFPPPASEAQQTVWQFADTAGARYDTSTHQGQVTLPSAGRLTFRVGESALTLSAEALELSAAQQITVRAPVIRCDGHLIGGGL